MRDGMAAMWRCACVIAGLLHLSKGYSYFQSNIPNGNAVPNPCKPGETWPGVGHKLVNGNGVRNPFGEDFTSNNKVWTSALCQKDSDLDGRTNGQELGDANCTWSQGMPNPTGHAISHPGICEPWNDPKCLDLDQSWVMDICQPSEFKCDAINEIGVQNKTLRIPRSQVPSQETTYMCQIFSLPSDADYHIIATTPIIGNINVMHHVVLFGCTTDIAESTEPFQCGMVPNSECQSIVSIWTPGSAGECMHSSAGFRMGANGFKKIALQLHWNNPKARGDFFDESGMTMYFTPSLRTNDAGILTTGQEHLVIPPGESLVRAEAVCPGDCTQRDLTGNIYITAALNHMHYLGAHQYLELYRDGVKIRDIASDRYYNYDNPQLQTFAEPIEVRPGDELRTRCEYSSTGVSHTTHFGPATSDEMCYSFITYYPKRNSDMDFCNSDRSIPQCQLYESSVYAGCEWKIFPNMTDPSVIEMFTTVQTSCPLFEGCSQACFDAVQTAKTHKCLQGDIWRFLKIRRFFTNMQSFEFLLRLQMCDCGAATTAPSTITPIATEQSTCDWSGLLQSGADHPLNQFYVNVISKCVATGACYKECIPAVNAAREHRCFQGAEWHYGQRYLHQTLDTKALEFLIDFESCNCEKTTSVSTTTEMPPGKASNLNGFCSLFVNIFMCLVVIVIIYF